MNLKKYSPHLFSLIAGILYASGFPMEFAPPFLLGTFFGMMLFFRSLPLFENEFKKTRLRDDLLKVLLFSIGYNLFGFYWIPYTLHEFGAIVPPFNYLLGLLFSLIIIPQLILFILINRYLLKLKIIQQMPFVLKSLILASIYVLLEETLPKQFPAHVGHPWIKIAPFLGLAPIFGAGVFSLITLWPAIYISKLKTIKARFSPIPFGVFFIFILINIFFPLEKEKGDVTTTVRIVQPNIGNHSKILAEKNRGNSRDSIYSILKKLSTEKKQKVDLIIWPETAFPNLLKSSIMKGNSQFLPATVRSVLRNTGSEILMGGYDQDPNKKPGNFFEGQYNAAFHFDQSYTLKEVYHKKKLIPFGESLPFGDFNKYFSNLIQNISFFAQGKHSPTFKTVQGIPFATSICYEILFPTFIRNLLKEMETTPSFMVNLTNDSWYGNTAEPRQHLFLSTWRSVELSLPVVRSTNTGISTLIYADGTLGEKLNVFEKKAIDLHFKTEKERRQTIFEKYGHFPLVILTIILMIISYFWKYEIPLSKDHAGG